MNEIVKIRASYWGGMRKGDDGTELLDFHLLENGNVMYRYVKGTIEITMEEDPESFTRCYGKP